MLHKILLNAFRTAFRATETLLPPLAGKWIIKIFFKPRRFKRPAGEYKLIAGAEKQQVQFTSDYSWRPAEDDYYTLYRWGSGPAVLLVHGWEGRGSQLGHLVQPLVAAGYQVLTFDAFAHGDSPGNKTNLPEFADIVRHIEKTTGGFEAIIGHSFGGIVAALAIREGVSAKKLITIGAPAQMVYIFAEFGRQINATRKSTSILAKYIENFTGRKIDEFSLTSILAGMQTPGLIYHDVADKEVAYSQAVELAKHWQNGELRTTNGLGHRRILRDETFIREIIDFIHRRESIAVGEAVA